MPHDPAAMDVSDDELDTGDPMTPDHPEQRRPFVGVVTPVVRLVGAHRAVEDHAAGQDLDRRRARTQSLLEPSPLRLAEQRPGVGRTPRQVVEAAVGAGVEEKELDIAARVVNAGVSGDTSAGGVRRIAWLMQNPVDLLVLELGGNAAVVIDHDADLEVLPLCIPTPFEVVGIGYGHNDLRHPSPGLVGTSRLGGQAESAL